MIIYEVNLQVQLAILADFRQWLQTHMNEMLTFPGFLSAELFHEMDLEKAAEQPGHLTVQYRVATLDDLNQYLEQHAASMRADGKNRFGEQFSATRRALRLVSE